MCSLVPVMGLPVPPRFAGCAVSVIDVLDSPLDLGGGVSAPVTAG